MDVEAAILQLEGSLEAAGNPERAAMEKRYLKSDLEFWGASVPAITKVAKAWWKDHGGSRDDLVAVVERLWTREIHESRMAAVKLLSLGVDVLEPVDLELVERLIRESRTWAYVDELAARVAGSVLDTEPDPDSVLDRWATDDDFWVRRSALLTHLGPLRSGAGDWDRFCRYADAMLEEKEFFIRKAIGWVLRDTARKRPDMVFDWILPRARRASGVTVREAVKRLSPEQAEAVMAAYRNR